MRRRLRSWSLQKLANGASYSALERSEVRASAHNDAYCVAERRGRIVARLGSGREFAGARERGENGRDSNSGIDAFAMTNVADLRRSAPARHGLHAQIVRAPCTAAYG
jgi:hypothetical protein